MRKREEIMKDVESNLENAGFRPSVGSLFGANIPDMLATFASAELEYLADIRDLLIRMNEIGGEMKYEKKRRD